MDETLEPSHAVGARLAPWSVILMVASAVALVIGAVLELWPVAALAGIVGLAGVLLLAFTAMTDTSRETVGR